MADFFTIGHSNRDLEEFLGMLSDARVNLLVDVRAFPRSRTNPVYNFDRLPANLSLRQIRYVHSPALGGRRSKQPEADQTLNAAWRVRSFHNYADYALGTEFGAAFQHILKLGSNQRLALMCSEAVWWRCHRRIITDYLILNGYSVVHLMAPGRMVQAAPTSSAQRTLAGKVVYPV